MNRFDEAELNLSDIMPDPFKVEVWQSEQRTNNRTGVDCAAVKRLIEGFNAPAGSGREPHFEVGPIYAAADAMAGTSAPGLPLSLLVSSGFEMVPLNYFIGVRLVHPLLLQNGGAGAVVSFQNVGLTIETIDGNKGAPGTPQDSYLARLSQLLRNLVPNVFGSAPISDNDLLMCVDGISQAADACAKRLLLPFDVNAKREPGRFGA